jgi:hypothetical protein
MAHAVQQQTAARTLPLIRLEHLWVILALSIVGAFISLVPNSPNDFWWHLKAGELVATSGIPQTNLFAWTIPADTPYIYQSWLSEWLFYMLYQLGGLPLIVFARNMLGLGAFTLVAYEAHRRSGSWRLAAGVVLLAAAMSTNNLITRTQNWSWLPFMLLFILLGRYADNRLAPRWLVALPVIMIFWVNAHGAFVMGLLVTGAFMVGETLRRLLRQPRALSWERLRLLYATFAGMIVATIVNPLGIGIYGYVQLLLEDAPSQQFIIEWQSPTPDGIAGTFFYLSILVVIASCAFARRRPGITDVILICGLAWQAFSGVRYVVWFGMVAMPIVAQSLAAPRAVFSPTGSPVRQRVSLRERGGGTVANLVVAGFLLGMVLLVQPWIKPVLPLPEPYQALFAPVPGAPQLFTADTPVEAANHLLAEPCDGHLFNEMGYGSYLDWALYPQAQVFIDPRVELYPLELWEDYIDLTRGRNVEELLAQYDITCVMLDVYLQPELAKTMPQLDGWHRTFVDERSEVWRR